MADAPLALTTLAAGQTATLAELRLPPDARARLQELGLVAGTPIQLVRFAPLGDPLEILLRGYHLTLRRHEAEQIFVVCAA